MVKHKVHSHHVHEEQNEHSEHKGKKGSSLSNVRKNPWILSTVVLAILVLVLIIPGFVSLSGNVVSEEVASESLVGFLNQQTNGGVEYVSSEDLGAIYEVTVSYQENNIPVYITNDGKYYLQGVVPLSDEENTDANTNSNTQQEVDVPKSDKPKVELFVMSYCPYGTQAEKGILPVLNLLGDKIDFDLRFVYYAMHPSYGEIEEQLNQYCIQEEQEDKFYEYLECFLTAGDSAGCLDEVGIDKTKLSACTAVADAEFSVSANKEDTSSWLSGKYPLFNVDKGLNEQYGIGGSPTLVINGAKIVSRSEDCSTSDNEAGKCAYIPMSRAPASYLNVICQAFTDGNVPEECNTELSTETLSSGFGWTTSSGSSASAQCA